MRWAGAFLFAVLLGLAAGASAWATTPRTLHLLLVSIDGLRPDFYLDDRYAGTELRALAASGSSARGAEPVFPTVTYPNHASIATGVRPARHGVLFNVLFEPTAERGRWYEEAADLAATPIWEWARAAGLRTASVSWPSTLGARIDLLVPERDYYARDNPLGVLLDAATPGLFERLRVTPRAEMFNDITAWDAFLTETAAAMIRSSRPHLLLLHLIQMDFFQHRGGRDGPDVRPALARIQAHLATLRAALGDAGIADQTVIIVTGDHGFQDFDRRVLPNAVLARGGLRGCPKAGERWRATIHVAGGAAAVFVNPSGSVDALAQAETVLRREARGRYQILTRRQLDELGAMTGAALGIEAAPGYTIGGACARRLEEASHGGMHGFLPHRPSMATGFIATGAGIRRGVVLDRVRLIDIAPTAARMLGLTSPPVEGRVLTEILE